MGQEAEIPQIPQKKDDTGMFPASLGRETVKTLDNILKYFSKCNQPFEPLDSFLESFVHYDKHIRKSMAVSSYFYIHWLR